MGWAGDAGPLRALEQQRVRVELETASHPAQAPLPRLAARLQRKLAEWQLQQALAARLA